MANVDTHNSTTLQVLAVDNLWPCSLANTSSSVHQSLVISFIHSYIHLFVCSFTRCPPLGWDTYSGEQLPVSGLVLAMSVAAVTWIEIPATKPVNADKDVYGQWHGRFAYLLWSHGLRTHKMQQWQDPVWYDSSSVIHDVTQRCCAMQAWYVDMHGNAKPSQHLDWHTWNKVTMSLDILSEILLGFVSFWRC